MAPPIIGSYTFILFGVMAVMSQPVMSFELRSDNPNPKTQYRIAVLLPRLPKPPIKVTDIKWKFSIEYVEPAVRLALDRVHKMADFQRPFNLTVKYADSKCEAAESVNHAIEFYANKEVRYNIIV